MKRVIGNGFVGKSTNVLKNENISIYFYDINPSLCHDQNDDKI